MKYHLQNLLDSKEKQLQQAATLGQRVLAQRVELEERIRQLQEMDADKTDEEEIDSEGRERYRELAKTIEGWDEENAVLSGAFDTGKVCLFFSFSVLIDAIFFF
jgi:DNA replication protein DnaC